MENWESGVSGIGSVAVGEEQFRPSRPACWSSTTTAAVPVLRARGRGRGRATARGHGDELHVAGCWSSSLGAKSRWLVAQGWRE